MRILKMQAIMVINGFIKYSIVHSYLSVDFSYLIYSMVLLLIIIIEKRTNTYKLEIILNHKDFGLSFKPLLVHRSPHLKLLCPNKNVDK